MKRENWTLEQKMAALPDEVRDTLTRYSAARKAWGAAEIIKTLSDDEPVRSVSDGEVKEKIDQKAVTTKAECHDAWVAIIGVLFDRLVEEMPA